MKRIKCYDKNGNSINHLIQWDKNQEIYVDDLENGIIPESHFAVATNQNEARIYIDAVSLEKINGINMVKVIIPNELLLEETKLYVFLYYIHNDADTHPETTEYFVEIPIKKKPRPSDQIYEDNLIFLSLTVLKNKLNDLQEQVDENETVLNDHLADNNNPHNVTCDQISALPTSMKGSVNGLAELDDNGQVPATQLPSYVDDVIEGYLYDGALYTSESKDYEISPENGKIYVDLVSMNTYRWSGTTYVEISKSLAIGETATTAYRGDRGKIAYDHSQSEHARVDAVLVEKSDNNGNIKINGSEVNVYTHPTGTNPHGLTANDLNLENVDNTSDIDKPVSTATQEALDEMSSSVDSMGNKVDDAVAKIDKVVEDGLSADVDKLKDVLRDVFYPVGTIYESVNNINPSEFIGGTWESWGAGKVSVGVDASQTEFATVEKTGGEKTHTLTTGEMPSHTHTFTGKAVTSGTQSANHTHSIPALSGTAATVSLEGGAWNFATQNESGLSYNGIFSSYAAAGGVARYGGGETVSSSNGDTLYVNASHAHSVSTNASTTGSNSANHTHSVTASGSNSNTGSEQAHNNLQPYITSYKWKRIA